MKRFKISKKLLMVALIMLFAVVSVYAESTTHMSAEITDWSGFADGSRVYYSASDNKYYSTQDTGNSLEEYIVAKKDTTLADVDNAKYVLGSDIDLNNGSDYSVPFTKSITIDINGFNINHKTGAISAQTGATLIIKDSKGTGALNRVSSSYDCVNVDGGIIKLYSIKTTAPYDHWGTMDMTSGEIYLFDCNIHGFDLMDDGDCSVHIYGGSYTSLIVYNMNTTVSVDFNFDNEDNVPIVNEMEVIGEPDIRFIPSANYKLEVYKDAEFTNEVTDFSFYNGPVYFKKIYDPESPSITPYSEDIALTSSNLLAGKTVGEVSVSGFDTDKFELAAINVSNGSTSPLTSDTLLSAGNYSIAVVLKVKDGSNTVFSYNESAFVYSGSISLDGNVTLLTGVGNALDPTELLPTRDGLTNENAKYLLAAFYNVSVSPSSTTISETIAVTGIDAPVKETALDTAGVCATTGVATTAPAVTWKVGDTEKTGTAAASTVYAAYVTLEASSGYKFDATPSVTIGGQTATVTRTDDTHITASYTFPETGSHDHSWSYSKDDTSKTFTAACTCGATRTLTVGVEVKAK